jgi:ribonuclease D
LSNAAIAEIAQHQPVDLKQLKRCPGVRGGLVREHGSEILSALASLREVSKRGEQDASANEKPLGDSKRRRLMEKLKAYRAERAAARGVTPSIVLTNALAEDLVTAPPENLAELAKFPYLGPKRFALYGRELLDLLKS